jgi:hypothetical protein
MKISIYIYVIVLFLFNTQMNSQELNKELKVKINVDEIENTMTVVGTVENLKSEYKSISFKLSVLKKNKSNTNKSNNAQSGRVTLEPLQKVSLSRTQINTYKGDQIHITLLIYDENEKVIGKDEFIKGVKKSDPNLGSLQSNDGLEMKGIITNDTKTKLGNDFYDFFFKEINKLKANSSKIIVIQEELTFGRTTKIIVKVEEEIIEEFIARPEEEYLEYMAKYTASKVFKYFAKIERQEESIFQY